jgi:DNA-binding MarR family transcriptional regulator
VVTQGKAMNKHIEQIDRETGEVMQGCMVYIPYRPKMKERWFMAFQDTFEELAKDPELTLEPKNVLLYLFSKLDFENFIQLSQVDIGEGLGMHKQHVSRAMKLLTDKQIILEGPKVGRSKCYRLNPHYGWKGKVKNLETERRSHLRAIEGGLGKAQDPTKPKE